MARRKSLAAAVFEWYQKQNAERRRVQERLARQQAAERERLERAAQKAEAARLRDAQRAEQRQEEQKQREEARAQAQAERDAKQAVLDRQRHAAQIERDSQRRMTQRHQELKREEAEKQRRRARQQEQNAKAEAEHRTVALHRRIAEFSRILSDRARDLCVHAPAAGEVFTTEGPGAFSKAMEATMAASAYPEAWQAMAGSSTGRNHASYVSTTNCPAKTSSPPPRHTAM